MVTAALLNINALTQPLPPAPTDEMRKSPPRSIRSGYLISDRKKLHIETKRQKPTTATRKSAGGGFKQPYSADPRSPSGYLTPITPVERGVHSAGGAYHHTRSSDLLGSPLPTSRSVYSPDSTSPTVPVSRIPPLPFIVILMT